MTGNLKKIITSPCLVRVPSPPVHGVVKIDSGQSLDVPPPVHVHHHLHTSTHNVSVTGKYSSKELFEQLDVVAIRNLYNMNKAEAENKTERVEKALK
jgi:hypothetical protein